MKEIKILEPVEISNGIKVTPYLTHAQIQNIVQNVCQFDTWAERQQAIDLMVLSYATDLGEKTVRDISTDVWVQSGIVDEVKSNVKNLHLIDEAIDYTQSISKALLQIAKEMPSLMEPLKGAIENAGSKK